MPQPLASPSRLGGRLPLLLALLGLCLAASAQVLTPVTWTHATEQVGGKTYLVHTAAIDAGWNVYSQYLESDDGPVATEVIYEELSGASTVGRGEESGGRDAGFDSVFEMEVVKFKKGFVIRQEVTGFDAGTITGYLTYMACDATRCLPPTDEEFALTPAATGPGSGATTTPIVGPAGMPGGASAKTATAGGMAGATPAAALPTGGEAVGADAVDVPAAAVRAANEPGFVTAPTPDAVPGGAVAGLGEGVGQDVVYGPGGPDGPDRGAGADVAPVTWGFGVSPTGEAGTYLLTATATVAEGWNIYAQDSDEGGPIPTSFSFDESPAYALVEGVTETGKRKAGYDEVFEVEVAKLYGPRVRFEQLVTVTDAEAAITGYLEFMACDQTMCLPPEDVDFTFLPAQGIARGGTAAAGVLPVSGGANGGDPNSKYDIENADEASTCSTEAAPDLVMEADDGLGMIFFLGFGGGLLALLTPCVFPMIPLTVSFFTARGKERGRGFRRALLYGASIIVIYVGLGLLITSIFGADALNAFSTNPWVNIAFGVLFVVFALSFFGLFEITLPSSWANKSDAAADQGGLLGIFFMAFTLSLVSFSCTGPIIGSLLVETAAGGGATLFGRIPTAPLVGMLGFSTALALPFTLFALFPSALDSLPKSGGWMNTVKVTLGVLEIAFAMKFFSTADLIMGTKWMPYELFMSIWVLCALALAIYYFRQARPAAQRGPDPGWSASSLGLGALALGLAVYFGLGFRYDAQARAFDTPNLASGLAPPAGHSYVYEKDCPRDFDCFKDYDEGLAYAKAQDKPILLDFTGHGCVNCRRMEDQVWGEEGVYERIKEDYVLISLYVDEREELAEPFVSDFSDRKLRTVGSRWADFQARYFDKNSQPYYVLMSPEQEVLNQPVAYTPEVDEYAAFLECGLSKWREMAAGEGLSEL